MPTLREAPKTVAYRDYREFFGGTAPVQYYKASGPLRALIRTRFKRFPAQKIRDGGCRITWMGGVQKIVEKPEGFARQEFSRPQRTDPEAIMAGVKAGDAATS